MGVPGLWDLLEAIKIIRFLDIFVHEQLFEKLVQGTANCDYHIGVDASPVLDSYSHSLISCGKFQTHSPTDGFLSQVLRIEDQIARALARSSWVFDGAKRPAVKRGVNVIKQEPARYEDARMLIKACGNCVHMAPGEGEAELAAMNLRGIVDAVITDDSDIICLGARCVMRIISKPDKETGKKSTETRLLVGIYFADDIETKLGLTRGDLIIYATIVGNDYSSGAQGVGGALGLAAAKCNYARDLVSKFLRLGNRKECDAYLAQVCQAICDEFRYNIHGYLAKSHPAAAKELEKSYEMLLSSDSPTLNAFIQPLTSWSPTESTTSVNNCRPGLHNLKEIIRIFREEIKWRDGNKVLKKLHTKLWTGMLLRMIALKYLRYDPQTGNIYTPSHQQSIMFADGHPFYPTADSRVIGNTRKSALPQSLDAIHIRFSTVHLLGQAMIYLNLPVETAKRFPQSIRVSVPSFLLAASAPNQRRPIARVASQSTASNSDYIEISNGDGSESDGKGNSDSDTDIEWGAVTTVIDLTTDN